VFFVDRSLLMGAKDNEKKKFKIYWYRIESPQFLKWDGYNEIIKLRVSLPGWNMLLFFCEKPTQPRKEIPR